MDERGMSGMRLECRCQKLGRHTSISNALASGVDCRAAPSGGCALGRKAQEATLTTSGSTGQEEAVFRTHFSERRGLTRTGTPSRVVF
jgi:hypothetical protein